MKSLLEKLGGTYSPGKDGMYYPNLTIEETDQRSIGKWGRMHKAYPEEIHPGLYERLILNGSLHRHLADANEQKNKEMINIKQQMINIKQHLMLYISLPIWQKNKLVKGLPQEKKENSNHEEKTLCRFTGHAAAGRCLLYHRTGGSICLPEVQIQRYLDNGARR